MKVVDFGLARIAAPIARASDAETLAVTTEGVFLGTVPYMSPEQIEGRPLDTRTDIFSLGVMLYEMASGVRPFSGASHGAIISSILRDVPPPVTERRPDLPVELERLISNCLEKERDRRIPSAAHVCEAFEATGRTGSSGVASRVAAAGSSRANRSIVVLPFANLSPDAANDYLGDGVTEEIIADLSKVGALSVISRTSAMRLKGTKKDAPTLARELGVGYVLDGSVRKAGNSLRITAQLIDAANDTQLWSEKYTGTMDDVFEVQERVSREIVRALDITLTHDEHRQLAERPISDARAFELVLQARQELRRYSVARAVALIDEAARIEGDTPPLIALRTWASVQQIRAGTGRDRSLLDDAERDARALLGRAPGRAYGDSLLGFIAAERGRMPEAVHHLKRALEQEPNDSDTLLMLAMVYTGAGQNSAAQDAARRLMVSDPLSPLSWMSAAAPLWFIGRPEDAIVPLKRALDIDPQNFFVHWCAGYTFLLVERLPDARHHGGILEQMNPAGAYTLQLLSLMDGLEGRTQSARERLAAVEWAPLDAHQRFHFAESFIAAGDHARGLELLEQSVRGFYPYRYLAEHCPFLEPVRGTTRFEAILRVARELVDEFAEREAALK